MSAVTTAVKSNAHAAAAATLSILVAAIPARVLGADAPTPANRVVSGGGGANSAESEPSSATPASEVDVGVAQSSEVPTPASTLTPSSTPPRTANSNPSEEIVALRQELDQLRADFDQSRTSADGSDTYQRTIDFYGFMDMGFQKLWMPANSALSALGTSRAGTFVLGNANLYIDANPTHNWRALTELRLTNYPNGSLEQPAVPAIGQNEKRSNATIFDVNSPDPGWNSTTWGAIVLQQAWLQGTFTDWLGVRVGYWLTPFGIWNIDHGTPTLIGLTPPSFTGGRFYPRNQLGVQAVGRLTSGAWAFNYTGYISNGKVPGQLDPTDDKAFGFKLSAQTTRPFPMSFGLAGYTGRYSQTVVSGSPASVSEAYSQEVVAYRQWDIGADVSLDIEAFRFRTEVAIERVDYDAGKPELALGARGMYTPNHLSWGWFTISAYRLPWLGLEPYLSCELYRYPSVLSEGIAVPGVGLNIHINTEVQLKTQATRTYFFDFDGEHSHSSQNVTMLASRLVIAY